MFSSHGDPLTVTVTVTSLPGGLVAARGQLPRLHRDEGARLGAFEESDPEAFLLRLRVQSRRSVVVGGRPGVKGLKVALRFKETRKGHCGLRTNRLLDLSPDGQRTLLTPF